MAMRAEDAPRSLLDYTANTSKKGVLLVTGFGTTERSVRKLSNRLNDAGFDAHTVHPWMIVNTGIGQHKAVKGAAEKLRDKHDGEPIAAIGWSLGSVQIVETASRNLGLFNEAFGVGAPWSLLSEEVPDELKVTNIVGRRDIVVPFISGKAGQFETIVVDEGHGGLPKSEEVFNVVRYKLEQPNRNRKLRLMTNR